MTSVTQVGWLSSMVVIWSAQLDKEVSSLNRDVCAPCFSDPSPTLDAFEFFYTFRLIFFFFFYSGFFPLNFFLFPPLALGDGDRVASPCLSHFLSSRFYLFGGNSCAVYIHLFFYPCSFSSLTLPVPVCLYYLSLFVFYSR